jgi:NADH-quinone oxidoreductase subunit E
MGLAFSAENRSRIDKILSRYPNKMAACLPLLYVAQEQFGHLSQEAQELVAATLDLAPAHVFGVATFYTMFNKRPVGRFHIQVCTNVSCMLCGSGEVMARVQKKLGLKPGESDGTFTLSEVECLAYCGSGPAVQVNDDIHELVSPDKVEDLIDSLRARVSEPAQSA